MKKTKNFIEYIFEAKESDLISIPRELIYLRGTIGTSTSSDEIITEFSQLAEDGDSDYNLVGYEDGNFIGNDGRIIDPMTILIQLNDYYQGEEE